MRILNILLGLYLSCISTAMASKYRVSDTDADKRIVIIGAGVSGVSCGYHLRNFGFKNVLILEAKDRVGGRLHTEYNCTLFENNDQYFIEMGCQWIHGEEGNAIYKLALSHDLIDESRPNYMDAFLNFRNEFNEEESEAIVSMLHYLNEQTALIPKDTQPDLSLGDFLEKEFKSYVKQHSEMAELLKGAFLYYSLAQCELNGCTNLSSISAGLLHQYKESKGSQTIELRHGYQSVLDLWLKEIPDVSVLLKKEVTKIDWTNFKNPEIGKESVKLEKLNCDSDNNQTEGCLKIKVYCADGDIYEADHVIITSSLGYMKKKFESLFVPSLPQKKITAIKSIGFGTVNKIYLEFEEPFWDPATIYHACWSSCLYQTMTEELQCLNNSSDWIYFISRFAYVPAQPNMLCAWISGEGAITVEKTSDDEVMSLSMLLLEKIVGKQLPKPKRIMRSFWNSDPQTYGSYSFLSTESNVDSNLDLAEPILTDICKSQHPVLQFAGEATHPFYYSTVHGAYETGLREARRLFDHYRYNCPCYKAQQCDSVLAL